jgi:hypothetical protein
MKNETNKIMNIVELDKMVEEGKVKELHTSYFRGYVSRKTGPVVTPYDGKFGKGYQKLSPNWESTTYSFVTYYIFS